MFKCAACRATTLCQGTGTVRGMGCGVHGWQSCVSSICCERNPQGCAAGGLHVLQSCDGPHSLPQRLDVVQHGLMSPAGFSITVLCDLPQ